MHPKTSPPADSVFQAGSGLVLIPVALWATIVAVLGGTGAFQAEAAGIPVVLVATVLAPPTVFAALYRAFASVRYWVDSLDITTVVAIQAWRVIGGTFVFLWLMGRLPAAFAIPAGFGDVAVGVGAAIIVAKVANREFGWQSRVRLLIIFGMLDFVAALATGILTRQGLPLHFEGAPPADIMQTLPMVMIPGFAVPAFIIFHMIAWIKLREM